MRHKPKALDLFSTGSSLSTFPGPSKEFKLPNHFFLDNHPTLD